MYRLISSLVIIAMIGTLAVLGSTALPISQLLAYTATGSIGPLLLVVITAILVFIIKGNVLSSSSVNKSTIFSQTPSQYSPHIASFSLSVICYLLIAVLAIVLIIASALQALISHQQAESRAVTEPMRVQALVTIEGISNSVYDPATNSGYRQVAIIKHISPLVAELTAQELDDATVDYIENINNSLSSNAGNNIKYRVLLNAYPKDLSKKSSKKPSKETPIATVNDLQPGTQLFMILTLMPLATSEQAINNPTGFDSYRWLRSRHIDAVANIIGVGKPLATISTPSILTVSADSYLKRIRTGIDQWRWQLRQHFYQQWSQQAKAVTLSLLTGDRSLINHDTKDLYQLAGISHLLAISGTHVLFLAIIL